LTLKHDKLRLNVGFDFNLRPSRQGGGEGGGGGGGGGAR